MGHCTPAISLRLSLLTKKENFWSNDNQPGRCCQLHLAETVPAGACQRAEAKETTMDQPGQAGRRMRLQELFFLQASTSKQHSTKWTLNSNSLK